MGDRCTGQCCKRFAINVSIGFLRAEAGRTAAQYPGHAAEQAMIADMLLWEESVNVGTELRPHYVEKYTCKHLSPNGDCTAYERRPPYMCGKYPYGRPCEHKTLCAWDAAREGYHQGARLKGLRSIVLGRLRPIRHLAVVQ